MDKRFMTRMYAAGVTVMMLGSADRAWVWLSAWLAWVPCSRFVGLVESPGYEGLQRVPAFVLTTGSAQDDQR